MSTQKNSDSNSVGSVPATSIPSNANVQSTINAIRTIAKTRELEQKIERISQSEKPSALPGINAERLVVSQAVLSAGSVGGSSVAPRDEDKDPGDITDKAGETAEDAAQKAGESAFDGGTNNPSSNQSTDKSDQNLASQNSIQDTVVSAGIYSAKDLLSDNGPYPSEKGDPNAPRIKEIIAEMNGKKVKINLREQTKYDNIPDGWDDADSPALLPDAGGFQQGYYWSVSGATPSATLNYSPDQGANDQVSYANSIDPDNPSTYIGKTSTMWDPFGAPTKYTLHFSRPTTGDWTGSATRIECSSISSYCPASPPRVSEFPLTGIVGLGWDGSKWTTHLYDSEGPVALKGQVSVLNMTDNGVGYELGPKRGGGWYFTPTGVLQGTTPAMLIRPDGTVQGVIDKNVLPYYTGSNTQTQNDNGFIGTPHLI